MYIRVYCGGDCTYNRDRRVLPGECRNRNLLLRQNWGETRGRNCGKVRWEPRSVHFFPRSDVALIQLHYEQSDHRFSIPKDLDYSAAILAPRLPHELPGLYLRIWWGTQRACIQKQGCRQIVWTWKWRSRPFVTDFFNYRHGSRKRIICHHWSRTAGFTLAVAWTNKRREQYESQCEL